MSTTVQIINNTTSTIYLFAQKGKKDFITNSGPGVIAIQDSTKNIVAYSISAGPPVMITITDQSGFILQDNGYVEAKDFSYDIYMNEFATYTSPTNGFGMNRNTGASNNGAYYCFASQSSDGKTNTIVITPASAQVQIQFNNYTEETLYLFTNTGPVIPLTAGNGINSMKNYYTVNMSPSTATPVTGTGTIAYNNAGFILQNTSPGSKSNFAFDVYGNNFSLAGINLQVNKDSNPDNSACYIATGSIAVLQGVVSYVVNVKTVPAMAVCKSTSNSAQSCYNPSTEACSTVSGIACLKDDFSQDKRKCCQVWQ